MAAGQSLLHNLLLVRRRWRTQQPGRSAMCFRSGEIVLATNPIKGKADPFAPNDTAAGRAQNRPVELMVAAPAN